MTQQFFQEHITDRGGALNSESGSIAEFMSGIVDIAINVNFA
jgi:hypothetical protein